MRPLQESFQVVHFDVHRLGNFLVIAMSSPRSESCVTTITTARLSRFTVNVLRRIAIGGTHRPRTSTSTSTCPLHEYSCCKCTIESPLSRAPLYLEANIGPCFVRATPSPIESNGQNPQIPVSSPVFVYILVLIFPKP